MSDQMFRVSHVQIRVKDIGAAVQEFRDAGFIVHREERAKTLNALIWFDEGPFIEIMTMWDHLRFLTPVMGMVFGKAMGKRFVKWIDAPMGLCDIALEPLDPVLRTVDGLAGCRALVEKVPGAQVSKAMSSSRQGNVGEKVRYSFMGTLPPGLPFIASTHEPEQKPVATPVHPNGATRITEIRTTFTQEEWAMTRDLVPGIRELVTRVPEPSMRGLGLAGLTSGLRLAGTTLAATDHPSDDEN